MVWHASPEPEIVKVTCRPSAPELLPAGPKVLVWGNSLSFDNDWRLERHQTVNCARQGMTAQDALPMVVALPKLEFSAIVLAFGSVELVRETGDIGGFRSSIEKIQKNLITLYPDTTIVVIGVPGGNQNIWQYGSSPQLSQINEVLRGLKGTRFLNTTELLSIIPESMQTYDGVHLTKDSYELIETWINEMIDLPNE